MKAIGIIAALHDEIAMLLQQMGEDAISHCIGQRHYYEGMLHGRRCVVVLARIGKVAAAATTVALIREFKVQEVVFTGVAGAVAPHVRVGDVVVATQLLQHDLDASPIFPKYEVPLLDRSRFDADAKLRKRLLAGASAYLEQDFCRDVGLAAQSEFALTAPSIHAGLIVSGDQFVNDSTQLHHLRDALPDALCVEMEGAAVAQICHEYDVPFAVFRSISDAADDAASVDFAAFLSRVARHYSAGVLARFLTDNASVAQN